MDPMPTRATRAAYVVLTVSFWIAVVVGLLLVSHRLFGLLQDAGTMTIPATFLVEDVPLPPETFEERGGPVTVSVDVHDPSTKQRVIAAVPVLVWWALVAVVLWLLRRVVRHRREGGPVPALERHEAAVARRDLPAGLPARDVRRALVRRVVLLRRCVDGWTAPAWGDRDRRARCCPAPRSWRP